MKIILLMAQHVAHRRVLSIKDELELTMIQGDS